MSLARYYDVFLNLRALKFGISVNCFVVVVFLVVVVVVVYYRAHISVTVIAESSGSPVFTAW